MLVHSADKGRVLPEKGQHSVLQQVSLLVFFDELFCDVVSSYEYRESRWRKKGLAIIPTALGIGFGVAFLNQAGALVHVYTDGSVLLTHGGMEMGQVCVPSL